MVSTGLDIRKVWETVDRRFLVAAFCCYGCSFLLAAYRWYLLLHHIKVRLALAVVLRLALIGQFFNLFIPGGVGGDLIKMVYLRKESKERFPEAVLTVLLDRVLGLAGLLLLALVAVAFNPMILNHSAPEMRAILAVLSLAGVCGLLGALAFFLWPYLGRFSGGLVGMVEKLPVRLKSILERVLAAVSLIRSSPPMVALLLLLASLGHLVSTVAVFFIGLGVGGAKAVTFQAYLLATQLSNLVAAVPLTPGGLGGRDLTLSFLLHLSGASDQARGAIPLVVTALLISWSALGGLALLWERRAGEAVVEEDVEDILAAAENAVDNLPGEDKA